MPKVKELNSSKFRNILHGYASEFTSTRKGEIFCKICDCLVKCDKILMVEAHRRSAKHQRGLFRETENRKKIVKHAVLGFEDKLPLFHFKPPGLFSNTMHEYALHISFENTAK